MFDLFYDFFGSDIDTFVNPLRFYFNTAGLKDTHPFTVSSKDNKVVYRVKTLGISKVDVNLKEDVLTVSGENEIDGSKYNTSVEIIVPKTILDQVEKIEYHTDCGITFVELILHRKDVRKIEITNK